MQEKQNNATRNRPEGNRAIDSASIVIDIPAYTRQIKREETWLKNDRNSITVYKTSGLCIVLGALHKDAELPTHKAEGIMSVQIVEGMVEFMTDDMTAILRKGQMIALHKGVSYRATALEESVYMLTISDVS